MQELTATPSPLKQYSISLQEMRNFFMQAPAAIAIFNGPEYRYTLVNTQYEKLFSRIECEVLGRSFREVWPELAGQGIFEIFDTVYKTGEPFSADEFPALLNKGANGQPVYYNFILYPVKDPAGHVTDLMLHAYDVTQQVAARKKNEESEALLRKTKEQLELSINAGGIGIWHWDVKRNVMTWSKEQLEMFGVSANEFKGRAEDFFDHVVHEDRERINAASKLEFERSENHYDFRIRRKDGTIRWIQSRSRTFLDSKGNPDYITGINIDITEQKEAEEQVRQNEEKYIQLSRSLEQQVKTRTEELTTKNRLLNEAQQIAKLGSWEWDFATNEVTWSDEMYHIYGYEEKGFPVTYEKAVERMLPSHREVSKQKITLEIIDAIENFKMTGDRKHDNAAVEYEIVLPDNSRKTLKGIAQVLLSPEGNVSKIAGTVQDMTDEKEYDNKIRLINRQLIEAQQIAQLGSWEWDVMSSTLSWSANLYSIYEVRPGDGINYEKFISMVHPGDRVTVEQHIEFSFNNKRFNDFYHRIITPAGTLKTLHARGEVIINDEGQVIKMIGTGQDVTEEKIIKDILIETNEKLGQRNQFVEKLLDSSLDLITVVDKELRFITLNKKAEITIKAYYPVDLLGQKITDVNPGLEETEFYRDLLKAFEGEVIIRDKVKSAMTEEYYEHNYVPLHNAHGEVYAVMIISHDITESIRQIEELRKLNESDKLKSDFIKMASHELKTPVTSIKGYVQLLLAALQKENEEKALSPSLMKLSLVSIDKQITRLTRLLSELLDLSRIETGKLELYKEVFNLNELVIETVQDILYSHTKHAINIFHDFGCTVYGDKDRIGQVLINLLTNAIKYSPGSDKIEVWIKRSEKSFVSISVKDYGIGIDKRYHEKIFERFYRVEGKEEQTYPGFGIGLFLAKEITQLHEGSIHFSSEKGKGSVFTFTLAIAD